MNIQCLIVDDEPLAIDLIERHVDQFHGLGVAGKCRSIVEAVRMLRTVKVDLIFLDIHMPEIDGISFLSEMEHHPPVILTTAYREHALQAFELGVVDYLVKPISFLRFTRALERFRAFSDRTIVDDRPPATNVPLVFKSGNELHKIGSKDILYIQSQKDYVNIITPFKKILVRASMKSILLRLPVNEFVQVHKSYIIPIAAIRSIAADHVVLGALRLPIGQSYKASLKQQWKNNGQE